MPLLGGTSEFRSTGPNLVPPMVTKCLYQGVHLTKGQPDPKADQMSSWPDIVPFLATRCLYWGRNLSSGQPDLTEDHSRLLDASTGGNPSDLIAKRTSEILNTLFVSCFASHRSFLRKTNEDPELCYVMRTRKLKYLIFFYSGAWSICQGREEKEAKP